MKLNKYQKKWIKTLKTRKSKKAQGRMRESLNSRSYCCLGVGAKVCEESFDWEDADLTLCDETMGKLNLLDGQKRSN